MEKGDHVSLTLSAAAVGIVAVEEANPIATRKSLRRLWNQMPRCQRNLIILGIFAMFVTLLLLLPGPGEQLVENIEGKSSFRKHGVLPIQNAAVGGGGGGSSDNSVSDNEASVKGGMDTMPMSLSLTGSNHEAAAAAVDLESNQLPHFKKMSLRAAQPQPQPNIEHIAKLPETQRSQFENVDLVDSINKINIQEVNINSNNIEAPTGPGGGGEQDDRLSLEAAVLDPILLPGTAGVRIDDFINSLDSTIDAQKQHFHGATNERQTAVVASFRHAWSGYKKYAWGHDNLKPLSQSAHDWFGLGLTLVDSLDTLYIMGLDDDFLEARNWVNDFLTFDINRDVNLFEVTIRVLGGLLASYHLSGDKMFLRKSVELGNRLLPCFLSPSGIPYSDVNLAAMSAHSPKWSPDSSTSEVTTIQLEFRDLSRSTNIPIYERVVNVVNDKVHLLEKNDGLVPIFINANTGSFRHYSTISLGARGDSYYEYLLKQWLQTGRKDNDYLILDYMHAIDGVLTQLMRRTPKEQHVYIGELINGKDFKPKMDHLTCYLPGTLLLGHKHGMPDSHLMLARDLLETCYQTYMKQPTQLAPEISYFAVNDNEEQEIYVKPNDAHNLLRPEFIESLYYFYALTGNRTYQDMGWNIFQAFEKHTKVANGYTSIGNVKNVFNTRLRDMMESFWLGETLKYFYLLFSDNRKEIDLDKWVFNSEAHPLPIRIH